MWGILGVFLQAAAGQILYLALHLESGSFPRPLSPAAERAAFAALRTGGVAGRDARDQLVRHNLRLVAHVCKKYYAATSNQDDLISIGTIGLIKGITTFKPDKKVRLATYASRCIENEILMYFRSQRKYQGDVSLSDSLDSDGEGSALSLMDVIRVDDDMLENLDTRESCQKVRRCVDRCLSGREAKVITLRYGLDGEPPRTQREIAAACGISRSYVSRLEKKALEKLREAMEQHE